jgi:hypothetical protein
MEASVAAIDRLDRMVLGARMSNAHPTSDLVLRAIAKRSFLTLATTSAAGRPHAAGVVYAHVDDALYVSTDRSSRKARNIAEHPEVFVCLPVRRAPVGPPSTIQFRATAELLPSEHPLVGSLVEAGRLKAITSHGELERADGCVVRIELPSVLHTYGLGLPLRTLMREPLDAAGRVELASPALA